MREEPGLDVPFITFPERDTAMAGPCGTPSLAVDEPELLLDDGKSDDAPAVRAAVNAVTRDRGGPCGSRGIKDLPDFSVSENVRTVITRPVRWAGVRKPMTLSHPLAFST